MVDLSDNKLQKMRKKELIELSKILRRELDRRNRDIETLQDALSLLVKCLSKHKKLDPSVDS